MSPKAEPLRFALHNLAYAVAKLGLAQGEAFRLSHTELFAALQAAEETLGMDVTAYSKALEDK